ncbi:uncharacterized protein [Ptychodera flava]|uniref:uncharacterized protein isoform X1 n=1 Tax=Ptychodera flava TaxID=63121 RepID=UPI00396A9DA6
MCVNLFWTFLPIEETRRGVHKSKRLITATRPELNRRSGISMDSRKSKINPSGKIRKNNPSSRITMGFDETLGPSDLKQPFQDRSTSASKQAEINKMQMLTSENEELKQEVEQLRSLYSQLVSDGKQEKFEERRVQLLKAQLVQLERQVILQSEAISSRSKVLLEVENAISATVDQHRALLASEIKGPTVSIERSQLTSLIGNLESSRNKLYRNIEGHNNANYARPLLFTNPFIKEKPDETVTVLDVCSGSMNHINLKQVAKLESKLFKLHQELYHLKKSLEYTPALPASIEPITEHLNQQMQHCNNSLSDCCQDLLSLSILIPAAPWGLLNKPVLGELTVDKVMKSLPNFTRGQQQQVHALQEELGYHKAVYEMQIQYIQSLFDSVREAYKTFERSSVELVCKPLQNVLDAFSTLKGTASEEALREFLSTFKGQADQLSSIVKSLTPADTSTEVPEKQSLEAISEFSKHFFTSLEELQGECRKKQKHLRKDVEMLKQQKDESLKETVQLMEDKEKELAARKEEMSHKQTSKTNRENPNPSTKISSGRKT